MKFWSHQCLIIPETKTEMRHALNVREGYHTVMVHDQMPYNPDTGKFDSNNKVSLNTNLMGDLVESTPYLDNTPYRTHCFDSIKREIKVDREQQRIAKITKYRDTLDEQEEEEKRLKAHQEAHQEFLNSRKPEQTLLSPVIKKSSRRSWVITDETKLDKERQERLKLAAQMKMRGQLGR